MRHPGSVTGARGYGCPRTAGCDPGAGIIRAREGPARDRPILELESILDADPPNRSVPPPGLRSSIKSTRDAGFRLAHAHIDLAKAEFSAIADEIKRVALFAGIAFGVVVFAVVLAVIGTSLFLAEWLLGSLGWGVLHGVLLFTAIAIACVLGALGVSGGRIGRAFIVGLLIAVAVALLMALALPNQAYTSLGESTLPGIETGVRPLVVGLIALGVLGLIVGVIAAARGGGVGAVIGFLVLGLLIGAISAADLGVQVGVGIGIAVGYLVWIALMVIDVMSTGVDTEAMKARFMPTQTIETSKETLAWLQSKMPPGTGS